MDEYVHFVYDVTRKFPKEELYSSVSQWRRSILLMILNYIEGYARKRPLVQQNFLEISFGSFKESKYLLYFFYKSRTFLHLRNKPRSFLEEMRDKQKFITQDDYARGLKLAEEIGKMLWKELSDLESSIKRGN